MNETLIAFLRQRRDVFPLRRTIDLESFLLEIFGDAVASLPVPAKIFLIDELQPHAYGFPVAASPAIDDLNGKLTRWLDAEATARIARNAEARARAEELLEAYRTQVVSLARNALHASILADYHTVFWLLHSQEVARVMTALPRHVRTEAPQFDARQADALKYVLFARWSETIREASPEIADGIANEAPFRFVRLLTDNLFVATEEYVGAELRELRTYFNGFLRRDFNAFRDWFESLRQHAATRLTSDPTFRRAIELLGYPDTAPAFVTLLDPRVQSLVFADPSWREPAEQALYTSVTRKLLEYLVIYHLRRGITKMQTPANGDNIGEEHGKRILYSRAIRPMNFGRRGVVEPIVYRYGLVYDITSFTETLGEIARGGREDEQSSYRQMLDFQRELAVLTRRYGLQFEKFLGDGAFYTSRRATRSLHAAIAIQQFYSSMRAKGFAFHKGMRIALNYGYYRILPMQVSADGGEIMEFYGPGIVELSRLTTGKATKELEDLQHLLLSHGYDAQEVYRFFAPLARGTREELATEPREFYATVDENGHLINEGIVASIPFLRQLSQDLVEDEQKHYRLRTKWGNYVGFLAPPEIGGYVAARLLGHVSLKGIGNVEVGEIVRLDPNEAEISIIEDRRPLIELLQQERNRATARVSEWYDAARTGISDLVVCESHVQSGSDAVILVGEWDPVAEEVRRPIQLDGRDAERYGLEVPLTREVVESQSTAYQKLYRTLSRMETLPNFSVQAIRMNVNFSGFIIGGDVVERL